MKIRFAILFCLFITNWSCCFSQLIHFALVHYLLHTEKTIASFSWTDRIRFIEPVDPPIANTNQVLIKNRKGLFVFLNGTGRLYQANENNGSIDYTRVDSTIYSGYDIGSFPFTYNGSIYSLGGYGFWRVNGQLRVFIEKDKQWDIVKLNEEIPILCDANKDLIWYDQNNKKIYIGSSYIRNEAVKTDSLFEARQEFNALVLDLTKTKWIRLGGLNSYIVQKLSTLKNIASSPWGLLVYIGDKISLLDYAHNSLLTLDVNKGAMLVRELSLHQTDDIIFFKDSTLVWGNLHLNSIDSFQLKKSDFSPSSEFIYSSTMASANFDANIWLYLALIVVILICVAFIRYSKTKPTKMMLTPIISDVQNSPIPDVKKNIFDERELQILTLLINNSSKGSTTKIEELNKLLGLTNKNPEIQKSQRSNTLTSINKKYAFVSENQNPVIDKKRSDYDARTFEYFIEYNRVTEINNFVNSVFK